jgi:hypothetical protein
MKHNCILSSLLSFLFCYLGITTIPPQSIYAQDGMPAYELAGKLNLSVTDSSSIHDIILHEQTAYISNRTEDRKGQITIIDIANAEDPVIIGRYVSDATYAHDASFENRQTPQMDLEYPLLYFPVQTGFDIVDVSNPTHPKTTAAYRTDIIQAGMIIGVGSNILYAHNKTLEIFSLQNGTLQKRSQIQLDVDEIASDRITDIHWNGGDKAYIQVQEYRNRRPTMSGIQLVDLSGLDNPIALDFHPFESYEEIPHLHLGYLMIDHLFFLSVYSVGGSYVMAVLDSDSIQSPNPWFRPQLRNWHRYNQFLIGSRSSNAIGVYNLPDGQLIPTFLGFMYDPIQTNRFLSYITGYKNIVICQETSYVTDRPEKNTLLIFQIQLQSNVEPYKHYQ